MLINGNQLHCLSSGHSSDFDKEGYLFVKTRNERLFNHWKTDSFVERFVRLKGNLLLIIATKTLNDSIGDKLVANSANDSCLNLIVLEEFGIKSVDESDKYYEFAIELSRHETIRCFHFATISREERDQWIQTIHLSSFRFLRSLHKTLVNELNNSRNKCFDESVPNRSVRREASLLLSITCHLSLIHRFSPKLVVFVYYRTVETFWNFLGKTETLRSSNPRFDKCLTFPPEVHRLAKIELKFCLYSVIESITNTKCLLGESHLTFVAISGPNIKSVHRLSLQSLINKQSIGGLIIRLTQSSSDCKLKKWFTFEELDRRIEDESHNRNTNRANKLFRTNSLPDIFKSEIMSNFENILDSKLFMNTICKSFQFSTPKQRMIAFIDEFMSESELSMTIPQIFMNVAMNDEKKLMNCITYSIGEVKTEFQRNQMRALECHLRLVNVLTESLNQISQYQTDNSFRPSTAKSDSFLQFVPLNLHLQRCLVSGADTNQGIAHDVFTVGAYCCHLLGFESGGMKSDSFDVHNASNNLLLAKTWNAMKNYFRVSLLRERIGSNLEAMIDCVDRQSDIDSALHYFNKVDDLSKEIVSLLSSKSVDESLSFCESVRGTDSMNNFWSNSTFERTVSLEETRKQNSMSDKELKRYRSLPNEEQQELEPIDLIHLNIKASVISINSKLVSGNSGLSRADFDPAKRKLKNAIDSLYRTSSLCYASSALKLDRQQIEAFYRFRLRRAMILSQALTALIIGTLSKLNCIEFLQRAIETRTILSEHEVLLSCYADELGMLEDMAYALNQLNHSVIFTFQASDETSLLPRFDGNSFSLRVVFSVKDFPSSLKSIDCSISSVLFNVGINECATLAETFGSVRVQDSINKESYSRLEAYVNRIFTESRSVTASMNALRAEIASNRAKNIRILQLSQQIVRSIGGLRFTSCKSGKDRTAMAVTLEEARLCAKFLGIECELNEMQWFQKVLDTLRSEGTRRENTLKNVGIAKYAFNSLQLLTFPKLLRAPAGTYSAIET